MLSAYRAVLFSLGHERFGYLIGAVQYMPEQAVTTGLNQQDKGLMDGIDGAQSNFAGIGIHRDRAAILQAKFTGKGDTQGHDGTRHCRQFILIAVGFREIQNFGGNIKAISRGNKNIVDAIGIYSKLIKELAAIAEKGLNFM